MMTDAGTVTLPTAVDLASDEGTALKSIVENVRDELIPGSNGNIIDENDNESDEFGLRPAKIFKFGIGVAKQIRSGNEEGKQLIQSSVLSKQELRAEIFTILKKYLKAAFTIIVQKKELSPLEAFGTTRLLGVSVPKFIHPSSLEYVEEVAKKLILFLHRNSSEGCAMHIMIEKNKTLHVVQRFVFRTMGSLDLPDILNSDDNEEIPIVNIDEFKENCRGSLLKLQNAVTIKPMIAPQYSRWSISIGLKPEFIAEEEIDNLWSNDPSGNYFPWKKRPQNLAGIHKNESDDTALRVSRIVPLPPNYCNGSTNFLQQKGEEETAIDNKVTNGESLANEEITACTEKGTLQLSDSSRGSSINHLNSTTHSFPDNEASKIVCSPLTSFPITANFMLSIYGLEYPAPEDAIVHQHSTAFSPRIPRSQSHHSRSFHLKSRHRLLRHFCNKF